MEVATIDDARAMVAMVASLPLTAEGFADYEPMQVALLGMPIQGM